MITIEGSPQRIHTSYNPVKYYFDSTVKNNEGFRYIVDLYIYYDNITPTFLTRYKVAPRPIDGIGEIDLTKVLSDLVTFNFNPNEADGYDASNCYIKYKLQIGEESVETYNFSSIANVPLTFPELSRITSTAHPFVYGDQIEITGTINDYDGLYSVINTTTNTFDITHPFTSTTTGSITYADKRKLLTFVSGYTFDNIIAYNAAESFTYFPNYTYLDFGLFDNLNTDRYALSNLPNNNYYVTPNQDLWINWLKDRYTTEDIMIKYTNSNGDVFGKTLWTNATGGDVQQIAMGPNNIGGLSVLSGTGPLIKPTTEWYEFHTYTTNYNFTSRTYRIYLDRRCNINEYEILYLDRRGSLISQAFQLKDKIEITAERQTYNKVLGDLNTTTNEYDYKTYDRGNTIYNVNTETIYTLNTNWMNDANSSMFEILLTSPVTYIKIDGDYYSCIVQDTKTEREKQRNKNLIKKTITVKLSNNEIINI